MCIEKTSGVIDIRFSVECPYCNKSFNPIDDKEFWEKTMGIDFPSVGTDGLYEATCPKCGKEFDIEGFDL